MRQRQRWRRGLARASACRRCGGGEGTALRGHRRQRPAPLAVGASAVEAILRCRLLLRYAPESLPLRLPGHLILAASRLHSLPPPLPTRVRPHPPCFSPWSHRPSCHSSQHGGLEPPLGLPARPTRPPRSRPIPARSQGMPCPPSPPRPRRLLPLDVVASDSRRTRCPLPGLQWDLEWEDEVALGQQRREMTLGPLAAEERDEQHGVQTSSDCGGGEQQALEEAAITLS
ncbi:hypothetical protein BS78_06G097000 [Paspalum vaginatum]|nr:hypothetical protein BS78_06G097000 [Paspalum vaginatum]